jgi:acetyl-CoA carboxylase biotin carboxyl carrier protein
MKGGARVTTERVPKKERESKPLTIHSLKKIVTIMNRAKITELDFEQDGVKIHLRKSPASGEVISQVITTTPIMAASLPTVQAAAPMPVQAAAPLPAPLPAVQAAVVEEANLHTISSPMVGTFYRAPGPESKAYVEVGSIVDENTVVCIVEAMKLMNEIKAEVKGVVKKILVENAQAVEFGQPLFQVERRG